MTVALGVALGIGAWQDVLVNVDFHRFTTAIFVCVLGLAANGFGVTLTARDFDPGEVLTGRSFSAPAFNAEWGYGGYLLRQLRDLCWALLPVVSLLFLYLIVFVAKGYLNPVTLLFLGIVLPLGLLQAASLGLAGRLVASSTGLAVVVVVVCFFIQALLPLVCCLPTFNLPLTTYFLVEPGVGGHGESGLTSMVGTQTDYSTAMAIALGFSAVTQLVPSALCLGIGGWRYGKLWTRTEHARRRADFVPCRHCGERIDPRVKTCPSCAEDAPFAT
jgi:fumarate reductase subunit D